MSLSTNSVRDALMHCPLFRGVAEESVEVYLEECSMRSVAAGQTLLDESVAPQELYIVIQGEFGVYLDTRDDSTFTHVGVGECLGEMAILENSRPSARVSATQNSQVVVIPESAVWELINQSHMFARNLLIILSRRLRFNNDHIVDAHSTVEQYQRNAFTDALTELNNRHWMQEIFTRKIKRATASGSALCIAMIDLDGFKAYNDEFGHQCGDEVLRKTAHALRDIFRPTDQIARFGGDEFAVLLPETDQQHAMEIAQRACREMRTHLMHFGEQPAPLTISIGVAELTKGEALDSLLQRSDSALYRAKRAGRNCVSE